MSPPATKARSPAPVRTMARTASSRSRSVSAASRAIPIGKWLTDRKCKCEKGKDFIQVILDRLVESNQREKISAIVTEIQFALKLESVDEIKARIVLKLQQIGEMP